MLAASTSALQHACRPSDYDVRSEGTAVLRKFKIGGLKWDLHERKNRLIVTGSCLRRSLGTETLLAEQRRCSQAAWEAEAGTRAMGGSATTTATADSCKARTVCTAAGITTLLPTSCPLPCNNAAPGR